MQPKGSGTASSHVYSAQPLPQSHALFQTQRRTSCIGQSLPAPILHTSRVAVMQIICRCKATMEVLALAALLN